MRKTIIAAVTLLLLTNIVVLAGIAYNRSGKPLVSIELSERELPVTRSYGLDDENSATSLTLEWHSLDPDDDTDKLYAYVSSRTPEWLDNEKLIALGFDINKFNNNADRYRYRTGQLATEVILVLEYNGQAYRQALAGAQSRADKLRVEMESNPDDENLATRYKNIEKRLQRLQQSESRLYVIDAALSREALLQKYTGNGEYLFAKGEIGLYWNDDVITGHIRRLSIPQTHVPLPFSRPLAALVSGDDYPSPDTTGTQPRYKVRLNFGKRLEPWIESVALIENSN